ncbi:hypothetical protein [Acidithiobacillus thiooxidans]|uniref:hypothetical protein n=1 Tax=Acidithiobacillus thiooxidans TaxID=930 RepID=UPI0004E1F3A2|nr:hypothetical protein [Acidithiobacillus thiooxidans]
MKTKSSEISPTVHLFLTVAQANVVAEALEIYARLGLGQIETITELFNEGYIPVNTESGTVDRSPVSQQIAEHCSAMKDHMGFSPHGHHGITDRVVSEAAKNAYEVECVLRKSLALDRDPHPKFRGTEYDGLLIKCTTEKVPVCVIEGRMIPLSPFRAFAGYGHG